MSLIAENISKKFGNKQVIDNFNINISEGKFIALTGKSGVGKSTLLYILSGMDVPNEGKVFLNNIDITNIGGKAKQKLLRSEIGFIFQDYGLIDYNTVYENMFIASAYNKNASPKGNTLMEEKLSLVGLSGYGERKVYELSGGEKQRVAIAEILLKDPSIIFADEPTGSLDFNTRDEVLALLKQVNKLGKTIVMVTHDPHAAGTADEVIKL